MSLNVQCQQFLRPNETEVVRYFDISVEYQSIYDLMVSNNHRFEMEFLRTNEISITISTEDDDLLIEIIDYFSLIPTTIEKMLKTYESRYGKVNQNH